MGSQWHSEEREALERLEEIGAVDKGKGGQGCGGKEGRARAWCGHSACSDSEALDSIPGTAKKRKRKKKTVSRASSAQWRRQLCGHW